MRQFLLLFCLLFSLQTLAQERPLVGIKDGVWQFFEGEDVVVLPPSYYDVSNPDEYGMSTFAMSGSYGIITAKGKIVVSPAYQKLVGLGYGKFIGVRSSGNELIKIWEGRTMITSPCASWDHFEKNWVIIEAKQRYLLNVASNQQWNLDSVYRITDARFGYIKLADSSQTYVYDELGEEINPEGGSAYFNETYIRFKSEDGERVVLERGGFDLPKGVRYFQRFEDFFQYSVSGKTVRLDLQGNTIWEVPYDYVRVGDAQSLIIQKNNLCGLMNLDGEVTCPPKYLNIYEYGGSFRAVTSSGVGVIDRKGNVIVPCKYRSINRRGGLYEVQTSAEFYGVYSPKTKTMLLQPFYKRVAISDNKVRGWLNDKLQIVLYDEDHKVVDRFTLDNAVSKYTLASNARGIDARLFSIGWFFEQEPIYDKDGFKVNDRLKWGIRNVQDSIIVPPKHPTPKFVPGMSFSIIPRGETEIGTDDGGTSKVAAFVPIDVTNGRFMSGDLVISLDSSDVLTKNYMRFVSNKGSGYITPDNKMNYVTYIDVDDVMYVRIAVSTTGKREGVEETHPEGVRWYDYQIGYEDKSWLRFTENRTEYKKITYPAARWNFLTPEGTTLFPTDFDFVQNFHLGTSIVKQNGKWGVTTVDTMVIEPRYAKVERMGVFADTIFKVKLNQPGTRFMDTLTNDLPVSISRILKSTDRFCIVQTGRTMQVLNNAYEPISSEGKSFRLIDGEGFYEREKKDFYVYNEEGALIAQTKAKPEALLLEEYIVFKDGSKYGLLDANGDTLMPSDYKTIEASGDCILASGNRGTVLLDRSGKVLTEVESGTILVDPMSGAYAVTAKGKTKVYNTQGDRLATFKKLYPDQFVGGVLFRTGRNSAFECIDDEKPRPDLPSTIDEVTVINGVGILVDSSDVLRYFDTEWEVIDNGYALERGKYLGEGVVQAKSDSGMILVSPDAIARFERGTRFAKEFSCEMLQVSYGARDWFINTDLQPMFKRKFKRATSFSNGYAAVLETGGWTLIDKRGFQKSLSSYSEISVLGNNLFSTAKPALYGLITQSGRTIVPVEYERINILHDDIIQAVRKGEIFYFDLEGNPIHY